MELKQTTAKLMDKNILSSLLALETSLILSIIIFFSLINPHFYYSKRVIFVCFFITLLWFAVTIFSIIKSEKNKKRIKTYLVSCLLYLLVIYYLIRSVWFYAYLTLAPEYAFFNGLGNSDTFYLSTLCESIKNFGYPALLSQGLDYHKYHYLSIVLLAIISKIVKIPCLITYNFLYPVVFLPIFTYLFFQAIGIIRDYLNRSRDISISDVVFSLFVIVGFLPLRYLNIIGIWWFHVFLSESCCVSFTLLLLYIFVLDKLKNANKIIIYYLITPLFLFSITATKISVGIIFFVLLAWIFIRIRGFKLSTILPIVLGFVFLLFSLSLFVRESQNIAERSFSWFHFINTYISPEYIISHIFFILFPALLLFILAKGSQAYSCFIKTKVAVLAEAAIITSFCSILPGVLFEMEGGGAHYFFLPAVFISLIFLLSSGELQKQFSIIAKEKKVIIILLLLVVYGESFINESYKYGSIYRSVAPKYLIEQSQIRKRGNRQVVDNRFYKTLNKINRMTQGKKNQYCLLVSKNCEINKLYKSNDSFLGPISPLALTAYLGIPIIDDLEKAKEMNIDNIIILEKNTYKIIK